MKQTKNFPALKLSLFILTIICIDAFCYDFMPSYLSNILFVLAMLIDLIPEYKQTHKKYTAFLIVIVFLDAILVLINTIKQFFF